MGEEYLIDHAEILKYDIEMAQLAKKRIRSSIREQKTHKKIDATADNDSSKNPQGKSTKGNKGACSQQSDKEPKQGDKGESDKCDKPIAACREPAHDFDELVEEVKRLVDLFSVEGVKRALAVVERAESA